ncbi:RND transporter MFP subunit [Geomonas sp. Red276]
MADKENEKSKVRLIHILGVSAVVVCLVTIVILLLVRRHDVSKEEKARAAGITSGARVQVAVANKGPAQRTLTFTGEARPYATATMYAKVSGYLKEIPVDKGDKVGKGDLLARLESPELVSQYRSVLADAVNKRTFAKRELSLLRDGIISQQEADDAVTAAKSAEANAAALRDQMRYLVIQAPFDGMVTARFADPGALVQTASAGQTAALPLVTLSKTDRLRVFIYLDQKSAGMVKVGDQATISDPARPERKLPGQVARISGELDPKTRTMLCEVDMDNYEQSLLAGGFVDVKLTVAAPPYVQVPATAVYTREEKTMVAVIGEDNRVRYRPVTVADSNGKQLRLSEGVREGDRVALNPGTGLTEGELVQPVLAKEPAGGGQ